MSERTMRRNLVRWLKKFDAYPVENKAWPGTPDVNYLHGWIELKHLPQWPVRPSTVVEIAHFTNQQRIWLRRREEAGGRTWLLLQVRRDWLLFTGEVAAKHVGRVTKEQLFELAFVHSRVGMTETMATSWFDPREEC